MSRVLLALVLAVAIGCYLNSLTGVLLFDDLPAIVNNPAVTDFDLGAILTAPVWWYKTGYISLYRPVATLTTPTGRSTSSRRPQIRVFSPASASSS